MDACNGETDPARDDGISGTSGGGSNAEATFECCCTFLGRMLDALNVDSTPGDFLPLLKIDGKCRFESRRGIWSVSCILCSNGAPVVKSQIGIADQKDSGRLACEKRVAQLYLALVRRGTKREKRVGKPTTSSPGYDEDGRRCHGHS